MIPELQHMVSLLTMASSVNFTPKIHLTDATIVVPLHMQYVHCFKMCI